MQSLRKEDRVVKQEVVLFGRVVSTVFLGIDHSFGFGPPLLFETMVFRSRRGLGDIDCIRTPDEETARKTHEATVKKYSRLGVAIIITLNVWWQDIRGWWTLMIWKFRRPNDRTK